MVDEQHVPGCLLDGAGDALAVLRPERQDAQDQHIERALHERQLLLRGAALFAGPRSNQPPDPLRSLSQREYEVFTHLVKGVRPKDIASALAISPKTVDTYRASLMRKLNVRDLVELVKFAIERNLTTTSSS